MAEIHRSIRQGLPKRRPLAKSKLMKKIINQSLETNLLGLDTPWNAFYDQREMHLYFHSLIAERGSGNLVTDIVFDRYKFNIPDQQTVRVRSEQIELQVMERVVNHNLRKFAKSLPSYRSDKQLEKIKKRNTQKRRSQKSSKRKKQRERNVDPPEGRYLSVDFTLQANYSKKMKEYRRLNHPLAKHLTKNRTKKSTSQFMGYHTVYDYEFGSRQVVGIHMLCNYQDHKGEWKRESLDDVVRQLFDPIMEDFPVKGFVADGDYYNVQIIHYLESLKLDYVIRAPKVEKIKQLILDEHLEDMLTDGQGYEHPSGNIMGRKKRETRLVIVRRGQDLTPLVLPSYSSLSPEQALLVFEERFGIETAYRELYKYLPATCSVSPNYRLALYASTAWFFNLMLNYYETVIIWSKDPTSWHSSLSLIHSRLSAVLGEVMSLSTK